MSTLIKWGLWALAAAAIVGAIVTAYNTWHDGAVDEGLRAGRAEVKAQWDADTIKRQAAAITAVKEARKEEQAKAQAAMEVVKNEAESQKRAAAAATRTAAAAGGVLRDIASLNAAARSRGLPTAAACPAEFARERDDAIRARELFGSCTAAYRAVAESADGLQLKLSTALGFIQVVTPAP